MLRQEVDVQLFLIEERQDFIEKEDREKISLFVSMADSKVQAWYVKKRVKNEMPLDWTSFREKAIDFCCGTGIENCRRFNEEKWSSYIRRLQTEAVNKGVSDAKIIEKLSTSRAPEKYEILFAVPGLSVEQLISTMKKWETKSALREMIREDKPKKQLPVVPPKRVKPNVTCYTCGKPGHTSRLCRSSTQIKKEFPEKKGFLAARKDRFGIQNSEQIRIRAHYFTAVLDSGSDVNLVTRSVTAITGVSASRVLDTPEIITCLNGTKLSTVRKVQLQVQMRNYYGFAWFFETDESIVNVVVGVDLLNKVTMYKYFPISCGIPTLPGKIVSWTRPIYSYKDREDFKVLIKELEEAGRIEPSKSPWLNPVLLTRKKTGKLRFCLDLRRLNDLVDLDEFVLPNITEVIRSLGNQKIFSIIDLKDGFWQVPLREEDRCKTAFLDARNRLMQFTKMPQGFKNFPAIFQRGMHIILQDMIGTCCFCCLDDILVFGRDKEEHDNNVREVKKRLKNHGLVINEEKSKYGLEGVDFLGYNIRKDRIRSTDERIQGIIDYEVPKTKKSLRGFLGTINYDRMFIKNLADIAKPLYDAVNREGKRLIWTDECQKTFDDVKAIWAERVECAISNTNERFELETDASDFALGAVLRQGGKPLGYVSRLLKGAEKNYGITHRETLAVVFALEKFRYFLLGRKFVLITDHKALETLRSKKEFGSKRIQRWIDFISMYDFDVKYIEGSCLIQADA
ncbi:KRAB-A domain-containing protein [Pseudoloma neurophilia]|uniref:RNA-directed DNA polymerase n=1 Tax=Pseudoloma neurophilia TaxID=146866 RepID=A0A0R0M3Q4_9MICR|nr:KRAB-A domain-containing protein [Pseudoloma neurophilia]